MSFIESDSTLNSCLSLEIYKAEGSEVWKRISNSDKIDLNIGGFDFSRLPEQIVVQDELDSKLDKSGSHPAPPPPPGPTGCLPPPPSCPGSAPTPPTPTLSAAPPKTSPKLVKLYWKTIYQGKTGKNVWSDLPEVSWDIFRVEELFKIEENESVSGETTPKTKILAVLDKKWSMNILIELRGMKLCADPALIIEDMDASSITNEAVEKLQRMYCFTGVEPKSKRDKYKDELQGDIEKIRVAGSEHPDIPLGEAEQFIHKISSIDQLEIKLRLLAFKVNFEIKEKEICDPVWFLIEAIENLRQSTIFAKFLSLTLSIGNMMTKSNLIGFQLDYITKLVDHKDTTESRKSLLYHIIRSSRFFFFLCENPI